MLPSETGCLDNQNPSPNPFKPDPDTAAFAFAAVQDLLSHEPLTIAETQSCPDWPKWKEAIMETLQLNKLNTSHLTDCPSDQVAIVNKWVFWLKCDETGNITHYKARLVAKGFSQIFGINYDETFAPVVRIETVWLLISLAACYQLKAHVIDIVGAYLNGKLDKEIYMAQLEGYEDGTNQVYKLQQSSRVWNMTLDSNFKKLGFTCLLADQCVYV